MYYEAAAIDDISTFDQFRYPSARANNTIIITITAVVVCADPRNVITGFVSEGASKVWHRIALTGRP